MHRVRWPRFDPIDVTRLMYDLCESPEDQEAIPASLRHLQTVSSLNDELSQNGSGPDPLLYGSSSVSSDWKHHVDPPTSGSSNGGAGKDGGTDDEAAGYDKWATVQDHLDALDKVEAEWNIAMSDTRNFGYSWLVPLGKLQTKEEDNDSDVASSPRLLSPREVLAAVDVADAAEAAPEVNDNNNNVDAGPAPPQRDLLVRDLDADIEDADARSRGSLSMTESEEELDVTGNIDRRTVARDNNNDDQYGERQESEPIDEGGDVATAAQTPGTRAARARQQRSEFLRGLDRRMRQGDENEASMDEDDDDSGEDMSQDSNESMELS
ncbi:hypothetical protein ACM66B_005171 [Microbotryomycetes sp. NB124-2]